MGKRLRFANRFDAGARLAGCLADYKHVPVVGLARGGVMVGAAVAKALRSPLLALVVRKLGVPNQPELAFGAVTADGVFFLDRLYMREKGIRESEMRKIAEYELSEARRRQKLYKKYQPSLNLHKKTVIVVDDGLATGATMRAALLSLKKQKPALIIAAFPTCAAFTISDIADSGVHVVCLTIDKAFRAVGWYYNDFPQVTDEEVIEMLRLRNTGEKR